MRVSSGIKRVRLFLLVSLALLTVYGLLSYRKKAVNDLKHKRAVEQRAPFAIAFQNFAPCFPFNIHLSSSFFPKASLLAAERGDEEQGSLTLQEQSTVVYQDQQVASCLCLCIHSSQAVAFDEPSDLILQSLNAVACHDKRLVG